MVCLKSIKMHKKKRVRSLAIVVYFCHLNSKIHSTVKKAYHRLSLKVHPDRVAESEKVESTEKFKILGRLYSVLTDTGKKALYDEKGIIDDDDEGGDLSNWLELWRNMFKPVTDEDIENYEKSYKKSEQEEIDIKKAYLNGKGCINFLINHVPFMHVDDEARIQAMVRQWIDAGEVPEFKIFTEEPKSKQQRRHKKYERESRAAEEIAKKLKSRGTSMDELVQKKNAEREKNADNFFAMLLDKYGKEDKVRKSITKKRHDRDSMHEVKEGKVRRGRK